MAQKSSKERKLILDVKDCFTKPELDGGEEKRKLWNFYREETDDESLIRKAKRDAYEHQAKYLMCGQVLLTRRYTGLRAIFVEAWIVPTCVVVYWEHGSPWGRHTVGIICITPDGPEIGNTATFSTL
jgi:hypothetical protein